MADPNYSNDPNNQLVPLQPAPPAGGLSNTIKNNKVTVIIIILILIALFWYFCMRKPKTATSTTTITTPGTSGVPSKIQVSRTRVGANTMY